jgi:hypothetical protein
VGPRAGLDTEDRGKILCPCRGSNPDCPVVQPVVRHYNAWATRLRPVQTVTSSNKIRKLIIAGVLVNTGMILEVHGVRQVSLLVWWLLGSQEEVWHMAAALNLLTSVDPTVSVLEAADPQVTSTIWTCCHHTNTRKTVRADTTNPVSHEVSEHMCRVLRCGRVQWFPDVHSRGPPVFRGPQA